MGRIRTERKDGVEGWKKNNIAEEKVITLIPFSVYMCIVVNIIIKSILKK